MDQIQTNVDLVELAAPFEELLTIAINDTADTLFFTYITGLFCHYFLILPATDLIFIRYVWLYRVTRCFDDSPMIEFPFGRILRM